MHALTNMKHILTQTAITVNIKLTPLEKRTKLNTFFTQNNFFNWTISQFNPIL